MSFNGKAFGFWMAALSLLAWTNVWAEMEDPPAPPDISSLDSPPSTDKDKSTPKQTQEESDARRPSTRARTPPTTWLPRPSTRPRPPSPRRKRKSSRKATRPTRWTSCPLPPLDGRPCRGKTEKAPREKGQGPERESRRPRSPAASGTQGGQGRQGHEVAPPPPPEPKAAKSRASRPP